MLLKIKNCFRDPAAGFKPPTPLLLFLPRSWICRYLAFAQSERIFSRVLTSLCPKYRHVAATFHKVENISSRGALHRRAPTVEQGGESVGEQEWMGGLPLQRQKSKASLLGNEAFAEAILEY